MHACMLRYFICVQLFVTLQTVALEVPLSVGFSKEEYWIGLPCPPPGDLPNPGIKPRSPTLLAGLPQCWQILYHLSHQGSPSYVLGTAVNINVHPLSLLFKKLY